MKIRATAIGPDIEDILGGAGEVKFVPLLVPMQTYEMILEKAKADGCTASDVLALALLKHLRPEPKEPESQAVVRQATPAITVRKRK